MNKEEINYFCKNVKVDCIVGEEEGFVIGWFCKDMGFGQMRIEINSKGEITADLETFNKKMLRAVLNKIVEKCEIVS